MSRLLFIGESDNPTMFFALCDHQRWFPNQSIGQMVSVPGRGQRVRKNMPELHPISPEEGIEAAEYLIAFENDYEELGCLKKQVLTPEEYLAKNSRKDVKTFGAFAVTFHPDDFSEALDMSISLMKRGYVVNYYSENRGLNTLLQMFRPPVESADLTLYLNPSEKCVCAPYSYLDAIMKVLREKISKQSFADRMSHAYQASWANSVHELTMGTYYGLYFTCTRSTIVLDRTQEQYKLVEALKAGNRKELLKFSREYLEDNCVPFIENVAAGLYYGSLISTHHARIANEDDVILSFLGSRRCNLRCKYCFSDHTRESLSRMSPGTTASVVDMVAAGCPEDAKIHFDNNLGGEPLMDFEAVKKRHLLLLGYHHATGIPASFGLLTNGTLLKEEHLNWLRCRLPYIGFSLDGEEATHNRLRSDSSLEPTYEKTVRGIRLVKASRWPIETGISTVLTKYNLDVTGLEEHFRDELEIHHVVMKPVRAAVTEDYALTNADIPALKKAYEAFFHYLMDAACKDDLDPLFTMLQPLDYAGRFLLRTFWADRLVVKRCGAGEIIFSSDDQGRIYPCDSFNGVENKELGNLECGMHNRFAFRIPYVTEKPQYYHCDSCWARFLCGGICEYVTHINQYQYNDVLKMECELSQILIELSLSFWMAARCRWSSEILSAVEKYIVNVGYPKLPDEAFVYAPC